MFRECALLSQDIYNVDTKFQSIKRSFLPDPKFSGWCRVIDIDSHLSSHDDFYSALYLKFLQGDAVQAVMAVRGTLFSNISNLLEDVEGWFGDVVGKGFLDRIPGYFAMATSFLHEVRAYLLRHYPRLYDRSRLTLTGHSLGGALAQLLAMKVLPYDAIVFNSPGCGSMNGLSPDAFPRVYNVNARYGIINKIGTTVGHLTLVDVPEEEAEAKILCTELENHENLVTAVSQLPETHSSYLKCDDAYGVRFFLDIQDKLKDKLCRAKVLKDEAIKVIDAQHSIDNMVRVLA